MNLKHLQFHLFSLVMICSCNYEDGIFTRDDLNENKNYRETLNFEKVSKRNLIVKIESEDNFELSDIEFNLSRLFPTPIYYDEGHNGKYIQRNPNTLCYEVLDAEYLGKNHFSCPTILIEKGKTTELIIKIGKRKWSNASNILLKFIPGILGLGPITNFGGYYFHRDYQIEIKTWTEND
jgi:hypothetical protein